MPRNKDRITFEVGAQILFPAVGLDQRPLTGASWQIVGTLGDGTPFYFHYNRTFPSLTGWDSPTRLGPALRRRILAQFHRDVQAALPPAYLTLHDVRDQPDPQAECDRISIEFFETVWRSRLRTPEPNPPTAHA